MGWSPNDENRQPLHTQIVRTTTERAQRYRHQQAGASAHYILIPIMHYHGSVISAFARLHASPPTHRVHRPAGGWAVASAIQIAAAEEADSCLSASTRRNPPRLVETLQRPYASARVPSRATRRPKPHPSIIYIMRARPGRPRVSALRALRDPSPHTRSPNCRDLSSARVGRATLSGQGHQAGCKGADAFRWLPPERRAVDARIKVG